MVWSGGVSQLWGIFIQLNITAVRVHEYSDLQHDVHESVRSGHGKVKQSEEKLG